MKLLMEAEEATLYDLENGYYVTQEHCSWIHQGYRLMIRPMGDCYYLQSLSIMIAQHLTLKSKRPAMDPFHLMRLRR